MWKEILATLVGVALILSVLAIGMVSCGKNQNENYIKQKQLDFERYKYDTENGLIKSDNKK